MTSDNGFHCQHCQDTGSQLLALGEQLREVRGSLRDIRQLIGPFGVPMPDETMLVQTLHGIKYMIDPNDLIMAPQLIVYRQWESDLTAAVLPLVTPDMTFVDVGANFGYFTCLIASRIGNSGTGRVFAYEPNPEMFKLLQRNTVINWSMSPLSLSPTAVTNFSGTVELQIPTDRAANASIASDLTAAAEGTRLVQVEAAKLDDLLPSDLCVDLLKVDVEGHEFAVLDGARNVIARSRENIRIVIEWSQSQMRDAGMDPSRMLDLFEDLGLRALELPPDVTVLSSAAPMSRDRLLATDYGNILLVGRDS